MEEFIKQLDNLYGQGKGFKVYTTIMPGIIADFNRMLEESPPGKEIDEEYHLEDGKGAVYVRGSKSSNGHVSIEYHLM